MSKDLKTIDLNVLPLETLAEMANEKAEQVERSAKKTVADAMDCGRYLEAAKEQVEPGKWLEWLGRNWNYSRRTAATYISLADHGKRFPSIEYQSIREAMKMIADEKADLEPEITPRAERITGQVEVIEPENHSVDVRKMVDESPDDDPTPEPPTIRTTPAGTTKSREADRTPPAPITPEILPDESEDSVVMLRESDTHGIREMFQRCVVVDEGDLKFVIESLIRKTENKHGHKKLAGVLRKWGNELDPPTKFVKPDADEVAKCMGAYSETEEFIEQHGVKTRKEIIAASVEFMDHFTTNGWRVGRAATPMKDWQSAARKWLRNEDQFSKGKGGSNGSAHRGTGKPPKPTGASVFG